MAAASWVVEFDMAGITKIIPCRAHERSGLACAQNDAVSINGSIAAVLSKPFESFSLVLRHAAFPFLAAIALFSALI